MLAVVAASALAVGSTGEPSGPFAALGNPWVISIVSGVGSGIFTVWVTMVVLTRRDRREHRQKVRVANQQVIYALRPGIRENTPPTTEVVEALIRATARQHGIGFGDLYEVDEVREELIREIMDSSFISSEAKRGYCDQLISLVASAVGAPDERPTDHTSRLEPTPWPFAFAMVVVLASTTAVLGVWLARRDLGGELLPELLGPMSIIAGGMATAAVVLSAVTISLRRAKERRANAVEIDDSDFTIHDSS